MSLFAMLGIGAVIVALTLAGKAWVKQRRDAAWQSVGQALGLQYRLNSATNLAELHGELDGVRVKAETLVEGSGKHKRTYTVVAARISGNPPFDIKISHEGLFQKIGKIFGGKDIQVGDAMLDKQFIFSAHDAARLRELVTIPAVKSALLTTQKHCASLHVERGDVCLKEADGGENQNKLTRRIRMSVTLAKAIGDATGGPARLAPAIEPPLPAPSAQPARQPKSLTGASDAPEDWW